MSRVADPPGLADDGESGGTVFCVNVSTRAAAEPYDALVFDRLVAMLEMWAGPRAEAGAQLSLSAKQLSPGRWELQWPVSE